MTKPPVVAGFAGVPSHQFLMEVKSNEGKTVCKADLRKVQDHSPQGPRYGHLSEPEAQAEAGLMNLRRTGENQFAWIRKKFLRKLFSIPLISHLGMHSLLKTEPTSTQGVPRGAAEAEAASILVS